MRELLVEMKRGGKMPMLVDGRCITDSDGAGQRYEYVEDLEIFWPGRGSKGKLYPVKTCLIADIGDVEQDFWEAEEDSYRDPY